MDQIDKQKLLNDETINRGELVWLMNQLISIFYDHSNDLALKLDLQDKPWEMFRIIFELMVDVDESDRTEYLTLIHDYLARFKIKSIIFPPMCLNLE